MAGSTSPAAADAPGRFTGIPAEAFEFYEALEADPTKSWWDAHKQAYATEVRGPLAALGAELTPEFGEPHLYRPYRDVRFAKDKSPYKDHQGLFTECRNGLGWYLQLSARGLMVAGGWYTSTAEQVARYRAAIDDGAGEQLAAFLTDIRRAGFSTGGQQLKSRPRGVAADHPQLEWLRYRTIYASRDWEPAAWMGTRKAFTRVRDSWRALSEWVDWLADVVGPGEAPMAGGARPGGRVAGARSGGQDGL